LERKDSQALSGDQKAAVKATIQEDVSVLCAPTAFGKTISAAALIAMRKVSALILAHRIELLRVPPPVRFLFRDYRKKSVVSCFQKPPRISLLSPHQ